MVGIHQGHLAPSQSAREDAISWLLTAQGRKWHPPCQQTHFAPHNGSPSRKISLIHIHHLLNNLIRNPFNFVSPNKYYKPYASLSSICFYVFDVVLAFLFITTLKLSHLIPKVHQTQTSIPPGHVIMKRGKHHVRWSTALRTNKPPVWFPPLVLLMLGISLPLSNSVVALLNNSTHFPEDWSWQFDN